MNSLPRELVFETDDSTFARLCIDLTFYWRGSMFDRAEHLTDAYSYALSLIKDKLVFFESGSMAGAKKLKADSLGMVPFWLHNGKRREDIYMMQLKGGPYADEPSDVGLQFFGDEEEDPPAGAVTLTLPVSTTDQPEQLVALMRDIAECADFESGHCGYSISWDLGSDSAIDAEARMSSIAGRFQGIDLPKINATVLGFQHCESPSIKTVQWLTFLGMSVIERFGGTDQVKKALPALATVHEARTGLLIQAGPAPTVGDVNRKGDLSYIKAVGRTLASLRLQNHAAFFGSDEQMATWSARFD
ncbi:MAG: type VI immunity family protein [Leptothrix sp. (in: b-proteobacteria)]